MASYLQQIDRSLIKRAYRSDVLPDETASRARPKWEDAGTVTRSGAGISLTVEDILATDAAPRSLYGGLCWSRRMANWAKQNRVQA